MQFSYHSFPPSCISHISSIVCAPDFSTQTFWFNATHLKEYNSNWRTFRNCICIRIRENPTIIWFCEVFQCLQEDVFKLEKANYLSFKSWRWHGAHIFASHGLASLEWILNFRGKIFSRPKANCACSGLCTLCRRCPKFLPARGDLPVFFAAWGNLGVFRGK